MNAATPHRLLTVEEYLQLEAESTVRHEYVGGELYAHAGTSERHNLIVANLITLLRTAARGTGCRALVGDVKLRAAADVIYYPDIMVVCDDGDDDPYIKERPCLIVEVLSPSTESIDRREKLMAYRRIESLRAYLMVYQDQRRVARQWRDEQGAWWQAEVSGDGIVPIPCPRLTLTLDDIYEDVLPAPQSRVL